MASSGNTKRASAPDLEIGDARFHLLVDAITDYGIFLLSPAGHVSTWNPGAERLKGYTAQEIIGQHFSVFYPAEDRASGRPNQILDTAAREGGYEEEAWRIRKDGTRFWATVTITPLWTAGGALGGFAKVTRDLTDRMAAADLLRQSEERFRTLVESVTDCAIYMLDQNGIVTTWNVGAQRLKGYPAQEIIGQSFSVFFPPSDIESGKPARELLAVATEGRFEEEGWRVRKDGSHFWANVVLTTIRDTHGNLLGFAKITRDLTARRQKEEVERDLLREQLARAAAEASRAKLMESEQMAREAAARAEQAAHRAEEASRAKDDFLATVSHELRTPLNAITGWASILKGGYEPSSFERAVDAIHRNAISQARIIDDILDVARIVSGKLKLDMHPTDLVAIANEALDVLRQSATARQIALQLQSDVDLPRVNGDADRIRQAIWNLISNAIKFSSSGGTISVRLERRNGQVELSVADTGAGIDAEFLPFVFERFRQSDGSTSRRFGGLGLGLAIVRHIVELHGGEVSAESAGKGQGACFRVSLPVPVVRQSLHGAKVASASSTPSLSRSAVLAGAKLLVVEDDEDARDILQVALHAAGAEVDLAGSAREALEALHRRRPQVLVSDIGMPGEDGYELMRRVRSLRADQGGNVPAIALTAYTRTQDRMRALSAGFTMHLVKPVNVAELVRSIADLIEVDSG